MAKLSIIVPIYNVEKYLPRCIDSILAQSYMDFELILVNDGSPDKCAEIMKQYAEKDKRIIVIHQKNQGVSAARNTGLKIATGKYVGFVDPDDWIEKQMYQKMIHEMEISESDLVCCNWDVISENMKVQEHFVRNVTSVMDNETFVIHLFDLPRTVGGTIWNKIFLREKIQTYFNANIVIGEDALFTIKYCSDIKTVSYINEALYHCFERAESATRRNTEKIALVLEVKRQMIEISEQLSKKAKRNAERDYLDSCLLYYNKYLENPESEYLKLGKKFFKEYMMNHWQRVLCNKEIYWKTRLLYFVRMLKIRKEGILCEKK